MEVMNPVSGDKEQCIARLEKMLPIPADSSSLDKQLDAAQNKHVELIGTLRRYMEENTRQI